MSTVNSKNRANLVFFKNAGLVKYQEGMLLQHKAYEEIISGLIKGSILALEHEKVITLGSRASQKDILVDQKKLVEEGFDIHHSDRGGQVTIHSKGQLVCYINIPLKDFKIKPVDFVRKIENMIIALIKEFDIKGCAIKGKTGVWVNSNSIEKKIAAIGIRVSNKITLHGFALNISNDLTLFENIVPCGLRESKVTSFSEITNNVPKRSDLITKLNVQLQEMLQCEVIFE